MEEDKQKHLIVGSVMGIIAGFLGVWGLVAGWVIIIGWEVQQALFDTGVPELADILYGIIPFTILWCVGYFINKRKRSK